MVIMIHIFIVDKNADREMFQPREPDWRIRICSNTKPASQC